MIFENQINIIDLIALLITLLSTLASTWRGLIKETLTIIKEGLKQVDTPQNDSLKVNFSI